MGAAWCRERIEQAQNSKSPVDRIITRCSNAINAKPIYSKPNQSKPANDIVFKQIRYPTCPPVPVHRAPPPRSHHTKAWTAGKPGEWQDVPLGKPGEWQDIPLHAPGTPDPVQKTPVPPPRRRKKRKINSLEVLNSQLDRIYESSRNLRRVNEHSQLLFGDPLPVDKIAPARSNNPERTSPTKSIGNENKRKSRAKKIMESKTKFMKKETFQPLSLANSRCDAVTKHEATRTPKLVKNISTISLPSYEVMAKHREIDDLEEAETKNKCEGPRRNISTVSLPGESVLTAISGVTMNRLEAYMRRCKSFGSLKPQQLLEKLEEITNKEESESSDSWSGLDDWDLDVIEYCDAEPSEPPLVPKSRLTSKQGSRVFELGPPLDQAESESFPPTPPVLRREISQSDTTFEKSESPAHDWLSTPDIPSAPKLNTPPPTPEDSDVDKEKVGEKDVDDDDPHSTLLKILSKYRDYDNEEVGPIPTPPRRKSREDNNRRRQSYQAGGSPKRSQLMARSMSMDTTLDEVKPNLTRNWHNLSFSSSRHSLHQALAEFIGYDDPATERDGFNHPGVEINLNSSLFPVIGLPTGDKGASAASPATPAAPASPREMEDDRKTPPPLPSSPPPTDLSVT